MKTATIETDLATFAYWLERDWPLVKQLEPWALIPGRVRGLEPDPQRERLWNVVRAGLPPVFAFGYVYAHSTRPGLVRLEWAQQRDRPDVEGFEPTLDAWQHWRFDAPEEDKVESRLELPKALSGRPPTSANAWAKSQFEAGKIPKDIAREYGALYEAENAAKDEPNAMTSAKALAGCYRRWKKQKATNTKKSL